MQKQNGYIFRAGSSWYLKYRDTVMVGGTTVRKQIVRKLAPVAFSDRRLRNAPPEIEEIAEEFLQPINAGAVTPESTQTLTDFVEHVYFPTAKKALSTLHTDKNRWATHLAQRAGAIRIRDFRTVDGERIIAEIARQNNLSRSTLKQCKSLLSAIFKQAKRLGLRDGVNPMQDVSVPKVRGKRETYAYSLSEVAAMLRVLSLREATIVAVAAYAGLRRSEIQGLTIGSDRGAALSVEQSVWEGHVSETKTEASNGLVPVVPQLRQLLDLWKASLSGKQLHADAPMFAALNGKPLRMHNVEIRIIRPALNRCEICAQAAEQHQSEGHEFKHDSEIPGWRGWHAFRRGLATNLHDLGVPDITIQAILRHSSVNVTRACYIKTLPKQVVGAMDSLASALPPVVYKRDIDQQSDKEVTVQ
jgi:integrase